MKKALLFLVATLLGGAAASYAGSLTDEEPALVIKTARGTSTSTLSTAKRFTIYLKTDTLNTPVVIDFDNGEAPLETTVGAVYKNSPKSYYGTMTKDTAYVKVYCKGLRFVNVNTDSIYEIKVGQNAKTIYEFRAEKNFISDFSFLNDITDLQYVVLTGNKAKKINFNNPSLMRIQLNEQPYLEELTIKNAPLAYELKMAKSLVKDLDLTELPKLASVSLTNNSMLETFKQSSDTLVSFTLSTSPLLKSVIVKDQKHLKSLSLYANSSLNDLEINNLPLLATLALYNTGFEDFVLDGSGLEALTSINLYNSTKLKSITLKNFKALKTVAAYNSPLLESVDLSDVTTITGINFNTTSLKELKINDAIRPNVTAAQLYGTNLTLEQLPYFAKISSSTSYKYAPLNSFPKLNKDSKVGDELDLNGFLQANGPDGKVASKVILTTKFEEELENGYDYTVTDGKYKFLRANTDSVSYVVTNEIFPNFKEENALTSDYTLVSGSSGIENLEDSSTAIEITSQDGRTVISNAKGELYSIYGLSGIKLDEGVVDDDYYTVTLPDSGIYIVRVRDVSKKVKNE